MICPKCDEGILNEVFFKKDKKKGYLCEFCGEVWYMGEGISALTGHPIDMHTKNDDIEYIYSDEDDTENKSVMYPKNK